MRDPSHLMLRSSEVYGLFHLLTLEFPSLLELTHYRFSARSPVNGQFKQLRLK